MKKLEILIDSYTYSISCVNTENPEFDTKSVALPLKRKKSYKKQMKFIYKKMNGIIGQMSEFFGEFNEIQIIHTNNYYFPTKNNEE